MSKEGNQDHTDGVGALLKNMIEALGANGRGVARATIAIAQVEYDDRAVEKSLPLQQSNAPRSASPTAPPHPGLILRQEFLSRPKLTRTKLASITGLPRKRIGYLMNGNGSFRETDATALGKVFAIKPSDWMNMQKAYAASRPPRAKQRASQTHDPSL